MALAQEDFNSIDAYIRKHLSDWLKEEGFNKRSFDYEIEIRERIVRVEEELKHQRELMKQGFEQVDKRFEQVDKRFEELREDMNKRFTSLQWFMGIGFTMLALLITILTFLVK